MADLKYTADFSQIAKEVRKNRKDLNDWSTAVSGDLQKVNREMSLAGKTSTLALTNMGKQMNRMGVLTQQAGYQIGDFIVQVQSGTNAFVAFGQQATQVAGTLTLLGGKWLAIGTALGIVIPLVTAVAAAIMRTRQEADKSSVSISDLEKEIESIDQTLQEFKRNQQAGALGISPEMFASEQALSAAKAARDAMAKSLEEAYAIADSTEPFALKLLGYLDPTLNKKPPWLKTLEESYLELNAKVEEGEQRIRDLREKNATEAAQKAESLSQERLSDYEAEIQATERLIQLADLQAQGYSRATAEIAVIINQKTQELGILRDAGLLTSEQAQAEYEAARAAAEKRQQYEDVVKPALEFMEAVRDAKGDAEVLAGLDLSPGIVAAAQAAGVLSAELTDALSSAMAMAAAAKAFRETDVMNIPGEGAYLGYDTEAGAYTSRIQELQAQYRASLSKGRRTGDGGGGGVQEDRIGALAQSLATETELLEQWYQDSLVQLSEFNAKELELLGGQNEAKLRLEQEYQDRLAAIEQTAQQRKLSETAGLFGALASIASTGGKKMAKIAATFGAIEATINAYKGATAALADPNISVAGRLAAYASVLAAGLQGVAAIRQAGGIGGGSGGGSGGGGAIATPATAAATPQRVLIEGIGPNDLITGTQLSEIFDKLYEENENRGLVFQIAS